MSKNNGQNERIESGPESLPNEIQPDADDRPGVQDIPETHAVLSDIKADKQVEEIVIDIENEEKNATDSVKNLANKDLIYEQYGQQIRPPRTTWVMYNFQDGKAITDGQSPLDYDPSSRNAFVRLTLTIVLVMILITTAFVMAVLFVEDLKLVFIRHGFLLAVPAMFIMIGLNYAIACSACTRTFPCNIIILFLAVICMSIISAWVSSRYKTQIVLYALIATCLVVFVCILLAFSGFDFTAWMLYIVVLAAAFGAITIIVFIAMMITGTYMKTLHLIILIVGTLLNVIILTMELQMILGGGAIELGEDDYALGAFLLYTSIVDIFLKLVQILGIFDSM